MAAIPPLLVWFAVSLYLNKIERRINEVESKLKK
jgi:hypothetical protein